MHACSLGAVAVAVRGAHVRLCVCATSSERNDVVGYERAVVIPWQLVVDGFAADVTGGFLGAESGASAIPGTATTAYHACATSLVRSVGVRGYRLG